MNLFYELCLEDIEDSSYKLEALKHFKLEDKYFNGTLCNLFPNLLNKMSDEDNK